MARVNLPKYRKLQQHYSCLGFVELDGKRYYLGKYGTPESLARYHRILAEGPGFLVEDKRENADGQITVNRIADRFLEFAKGYYVKNSVITSEVSLYERVIRILRDQYGNTPATEFGPSALKAVRYQMLQNNWCRKLINQQIGRVKHLFKWAVAEELVPPTVYTALQAVEGLKKGRTTAVDHAPIKPVPVEHIQAVRPHVSRQVAALIDLQLLTGSRAGELVIMRPIDLQITGNVWKYTPASHKTEHHGHQRTILIGPQAQDTIKPFLTNRPTTAFVFSPAEASREHIEVRHKARVTPLSCGNHPGSNRKKDPIRKPGDCYTVASYRRSIERACRKAGVPTWSPHRLRHNAGTIIRREYGLEAARIILGHHSPMITEIYAEADMDKAVDVIRRIG